MTGVAMLMVGGARSCSVSVSPATVTGTGFTGSPNGNVSATTGAATVTVTGTGTFAYAWAHVSGDNAGINSPAAAATTFTRLAGAGSSVGGSSRTYSGVFRCTVTQSGVSRTVDVTVQTTHTYTGP